MSDKTLNHNINASAYNCLNDNNLTLIIFCIKVPLAQESKKPIIQGTKLERVSEMEEE
jgi:hypothetical protein